MTIRQGTSSRKGLCQSVPSGARVYVGAIGYGPCGADALLDDFAWDQPGEKARIVRWQAAICPFFPQKNLQDLRPPITLNMVIQRLHIDSVPQQGVAAGQNPE